MELKNNRETERTGEGGLGETEERVDVNDIRTCLAQCPGEGREVARRLPRSREHAGSASPRANAPAHRLRVLSKASQRRFGFGEERARAREPAVRAPACAAKGLECADDGKPRAEALRFVEDDEEPAFGLALVAQAETPCAERRTASSPVI